MVLFVSVCTYVYLKSNWGGYCINLQLIIHVHVYRGQVCSCKFLSKDNIWPSEQEQLGLCISDPIFCTE